MVKTVEPNRGRLIDNKCLDSTFTLKMKIRGYGDQEIKIVQSSVVPDDVSSFDLINIY